MKDNDTIQLTLENLESPPITHGTVILNKEKFIEVLVEPNILQDLNSIKKRTSMLKDIITEPKKDTKGIVNIDANGDTVSLRKDVLISEFDQILESQTIERAKYYLERLENGIQKIKTSKINDINILRWKEYDEIITDSLWIIPERDKTGKHNGFYHGNFIPQIPHQLILRYTKKNEIVFDPFLGSGTTAYEAESLNRNFIGIDIQKKLVDFVGKNVEPKNNFSDLIAGDSTKIETFEKVKEVLKNHKKKNVQLAILHPPYADIIKFSDLKDDLSNAKSLKEFLEKFAEVLENSIEILENVRYLAIVIGDKYTAGEWIPLGFYCMNEAQKLGLTLKSIIIKNMAGNRAKQNKERIWRYRALSSDYYIFKHEYILIFKK